MRFLTPVLLAVLLAPSGAYASDAAFPSTLQSAWQDLGQLEDLLDDRDASNRDLIVYLDLVSETARSLALPERSEGQEASGDEARERRKWGRSIEKFRGETMDLLLEAITETNLDRSGENIRESVNEHAGSVLARTTAILEEDDDRARLSRRVISKVKRLERARHPVAAGVFEGAFLTLAALGQPKSLKWLMDNYVHARKQPEEVARLRAALRAMRRFEEMPGRLRYDLVDEMLKRYVAMEALAEVSTTDVAAQAAKRFWDQVRTDAIPLIQYVAGYPKTKAGTALASMKEFAEWFREHDNVRADVWSNELKGA